MSPKPRTIVAALSVLYLLALTILAAYALHRNNALSLPIPNILAALTIALPSLAGVAIETATSLVTSANNSATSTSNSLTTNSKKPRISPARATQILHLTLAVLLVYETVVATLAGEHVRASDCGLHEVWQGMFHRKDGERIRAIQDALRCCGFASTRDMAWPFPGSGRDAGACAARYDGAGTVSRCFCGSACYLQSPRAAATAGYHLGFSCRVTVSATSAVGLNSVMPKRLAKRTASLMKYAA